MRLTPVEREILVTLLMRGDDLPANVAKEIGRHKRSVGRSMGNLEDKGLLRDKGSGVRTLTLDGIHVARELVHSDKDEN